MHLTRSLRFSSGNVPDLPAMSEGCLLVPHGYFNRRCPFSYHMTFSEVYSDKSRPMIFTKQSLRTFTGNWLTIPIHHSGQYLLCHLNRRLKDCPMFLFSSFPCLNSCFPMATISAFHSNSSLHLSYNINSCCLMELPVVAGIV